ncbi:MAG: hypothetical protein WDO19_29990 [Bacteroidota bacterium]
MLLEAGADSNNTGDEQGIKWDAETSILAPYGHLHGLAPLYILRHLEAYQFYEYGSSIEEIDQITAAIERLLLDYNASTICVENRE